MTSTEQLKATLRARGLRMTPQRQLILDVVAEMQGHVSVDQVYRQVVRSFPDVNVTTVYRTLEVLEEIGIVRHTHFHDGVAQFQRTDEPPHHHMVCTRCGMETNIDLALLQPLADALRVRYDFEADLTHSAIVGVCSDCRRAE